MSTKKAVWVDKTADFPTCPPKSGLGGESAWGIREKRAHVQNPVFEKLKKLSYLS